MRSNFLAGLACVIILLKSGYSADLYVALGDSVTNAARAGTRIGGYVEPVLEEAGLLPNSGDNPSPLFANKFSWATGSNIFSQQLLLGTFLSRSNFTPDFEFLNVSENGKNSVAMPAQAKKAADAMASGKFDSLIYVTLLVGANDICDTKNANGTPDDIFHEALMQTFRTLAAVQQRDPVQILVMGLPNIPDLGRDEVNNAQVSKGISCRQIRKLLGIEAACGRVLYWNGPEEYVEHVQVIEHRNSALRSAVDQANKELRNVRAVYSNSLFESHVSLSDLAADCFHPNFNGQQKISFRAWEDQPFFFFKR